MANGEWRGRALPSPARGRRCLDPRVVPSARPRINSVEADEGRGENAIALRIVSEITVPPMTTPFGLRLERRAGLPMIDKGRDMAAIPGPRSGQASSSAPHPPSRRSGTFSHFVGEGRNALGEMRACRGQEAAAPKRRRSSRCGSLPRSPRARLRHASRRARRPGRDLACRLRPVRPARARRP